MKEYNRAARLLFSLCVIDLLSVCDDAEKKKKNTMAHSCSHMWGQPNMWLFKALVSLIEYWADAHTDVDCLFLLATPAAQVA